MAAPKPKRYAALLPPEVLADDALVGRMLVRLVDRLPQLVGAGATVATTRLTWRAVPADARDPGRPWERGQPLPDWAVGCVLTIERASSSPEQGRLECGGD